MSEEGIESPALLTALSMGWPEIRVLRDDATLAPLIPSTPWPHRSRAEAIDYLRASFASGFKTYSLARADDIARGDVLMLLRHIIPFGWPKWFDAACDDLFLIEALLGADVLLDVMIGALEEISANEWKRASRGAFFVFYAMGFVLLRSAGATANRARLETLYAKRADEARASSLTRALDLILHGAAGVNRSAERPDDALYCLFVDDDPEFLRAIIHGERFQKYDRRFAARLAFLIAREDASSIRDAITARWYRVGNEEQRAFFAQTAGLVFSPLPDEPAPIAPIAPPSQLDGAIASECEGDEFGFVILSAEGAMLLRGDEDDHSTLSVNADAASPDPIMTKAPRTNESAIFFCLAERVSIAPAEDGGALIIIDPHSSESGGAEGEEQLSFDELGALTLETGKVAGLSASLTLSDARESGQAIELALLMPGTYAVMVAGNVIWLRKAG